MQNICSRRFNRRCALAIVALSFVVGSTPASASAATKVKAKSQSRQVTIENMQFAPKELSVHSGDQVTWTNKDLVPHTVTSLDGKFDSKTIAPNAQWSYRVRQTGTLKYKCNFHPTMEATMTAK